LVSWMILRVQRCTSRRRRSQFYTSALLWKKTFA